MLNVTFPFLSPLLRPFSYSTVMSFRTLMRSQYLTTKLKSASILETGNYLCTHDVLHYSEVMALHLILNTMLYILESPWKLRKKP